MHRYDLLGSDRDLEAAFQDLLARLPWKRVRLGSRVPDYLNAELIGMT